MAGNLDRDAFFLLERVRSTVREPALGVVPWKGRELVRLLSELDLESSDPGAVYLSFMDGLRRHILEADDAQDVLFRRLLSHNVLTEPDLHALSPGTRDHLVHVTQVFLLGWLVMNGTSVFAEAPVSWRPYGWETERLAERHEKLNRAWMFASLLHDCGYSVELSGSLQRRESAVGAAFGEMYETGIPGALVGPNLTEHLSRLWEWRCEVTGLPRTIVEKAAGKNAKQVERRDHAFAGASAFERQAQRWRSGREEEVRAAALAIACHNFQYLVEKGAAPFSSAACKCSEAVETGNEDKPAWVNQWFSLSFEREPVSALLHLCDELQEWSRERADEAVAHRIGLRRQKYSSTRIVGLHFPDAHRLSLDVALHRQPVLTGVGEAYEKRLAMQEDRDTALRTRRLTRLFGRDDEGRFRLSLRVRQAVGFAACRCELRIGREREPRGLLEEFEQRLAKRARVPHLEAVEVRISGQCDLAVEEGCAEYRVYGAKPLRLAFVLPGGRGKSTFLAELARLPVSGRRIVYVEELPGELVDLPQEVARLGRDENVRITLLIDHLDRLVDEDYFIFWLEQIRALCDSADLDVFVACRPEEYDRFVRPTLPSFQVVDDRTGWTTTCHGITRTLVSGRPRACELEDALSGDPDGGDRAALAVFACGMRQSRASAMAPPAGSLRVAGRDVTIRGADESYRFMHDCVQDLFAASRLLHVLAGESPETALRELRELPRDVFRMLVELLNRRSDGALASAEVRGRARAGFAVGLLEEATTQQWLYDTGRLHQAREAVDEYAARAEAGTLEQAIGRKHSGHLQYARGSLRELRKEDSRDAHRGYYEQAIRQSVEAAVAAESCWQTSEERRAGLAWLLTFLADHLLLALIRIASVPELVRHARGLAGEMSGRLQRSGENTRAAEPGWIGGLLERYSCGTGHEDDDAVWETLDQGLAELRQGELRGADDHLLDVRRGHIACHIGLHYLDHAYISNLTEENVSRYPTQVERLRQAEEWFERSISRRERVVMRMDAERRSGERIRGEVYGTFAAGLGDAAHQYRGVFEALLFMLRSPSRPPTLLAELSDAARRMEEAWTRAQNALQPSERLPVYYLESVHFIAAGRAIRAALGRVSRSGAPTAEEVKGFIKSELEELVTDLSGIAEGAMRAETTNYDVQTFLKRLMAGVPNVCVAVAEELLKMTNAERAVAGSQRA